MSSFQLISNFSPRGDQPRAIEELTQNIGQGIRFQTLLGVTGSGKTFTMANVIAHCNKPTLVISHNKTLAAQLYGEFKGFFPNNAVEYFVSYYDYYQPEAYLPETDTYIEKDSSINEDIDKLRLRATSSLLERKDVIIVASVSCIYGLGSPQTYQEMMVFLELHQSVERNEIIRKLIDIHYHRNEIGFERGTFRVRGDVLDVHLAYDDFAIRIELFGNEIIKLCKTDLLSGKVFETLEKIAIYPAKHFVTAPDRIRPIIEQIRFELSEQLSILRQAGKGLESQRLESRTNYDIEMLQEMGYCNGIENYSRIFASRKPGDRPNCLFDFFPNNFLLIIDESHVSIPQIRGMYAGDRSRKEKLIEFGFRLPCALDNRPLNFSEFEQMMPQVIFVSATPSEYELQKSEGLVVEQVIRPTGLVDPEILVRPARNQIDDLLYEIRQRVKRQERVLITTLTKRMAEDLTEYLQDLGIKVKYLHSEIQTLDRVEILRDLRLAKFDVLVGINLLREGLDLPEVSLVAILDADKEGFLRSERSLIQTAGRASRNAGGQVILYADQRTESINRALSETARRRQIQMDHNQKHNIVPQTIYKSTEETLLSTSVADAKSKGQVSEPQALYLPFADAEEKMAVLKQMMLDAADNLDFETASRLRDEIQKISASKNSRKKNTTSKLLRQ